MILQNHSLDQVSHFKNCISLELGPCTLHLKIVCFTCDKRTVKKLNSVFLLTVCEYFKICTRSKPMGLSLCLKDLVLVMYCTSKTSLHSPDFLSLT